jgi:hypothetical protein
MKTGVRVGRVDEDARVKAVSGEREKEREREREREKGRGRGEGEKVESGTPRSMFKSGC